MRLIGERIYLRSTLESDASIMLEYTQNEEIRYMTGTTTEFTLEQIIAHIRNVKKDTSRYDFAICLKDSDEMIGELAILDIDEENKKAGFRITLASISLTGKGYGTEAMKLIIDFVFNQLKLNRIELEVFSHNLRGIRAYEKIGFVKEGVLRQSLYYNDTYSDEIIMAMLKSDYDRMYNLIN